jgi:hypothetical protein
MLLAPSYSLILRDGSLSIFNRLTIKATTTTLTATKRMEKCRNAPIDWSDKEENLCKSNVALAFE